MTYEKIVTLYDTAEHADSAKRSLQAAGFAPSEISSLSKSALSSGTEKLVEPALWQRLFGREIERHEAIVYGDTIESGGVVLTVRVERSDVPKALAILNAQQAVDVRHRAVQQGLISATATPPPVATPPKPATVAAAGVLGREEVLGLAEEQLDVGKRLIVEGTTRIRRFVVETPVEQQITLHEEHVKVIRRASSDTGRNVDWTDKVIEIAETAEEPMVTKSSRVAEEVVIQREASDEVKTVRDKIRRQQIDVEKIPGHGPASNK